MGKILAKSTGVSLKRHTEDVRETFLSLKSHFKRTGRNPLEDFEGIEDEILKAIEYHDLGKVLPYFQIAVLKNTGYRPFDLTLNVPHSFVSLLFVPGDFSDDVRVAVAYHHWRENFEEIIGKGWSALNELAKRLLKDTNFRNALLENLKNEMGKAYRLNEDITQSLARGLSVSDPRIAPPPYGILSQISDREITDRNRRGVLIRGLLQRADHFASWVEEEEEGVSFSNVEIPPRDRDEVHGAIKERIGEGAWQFVKLKETDGNLILVAPTGYGKTEFAFLWSAGYKAIYTLPLRAAVNQMFHRAEDVFGTEKLGLLHSDADVFYLERGEDFTSYALARQLAHPFLVSTGDQFFPYALKPPTFEKIYAVISYSKLTVDEVQAYDPRAAAIIVKFLEDTVKMGGNFLLMTATLPEFVREEVINRVGEIPILNIYEDNEEDFRRIRKHRVELRFLVADEGDGEGKGRRRRKAAPGFDGEIEEILRHAREGKRVIVIRNTVASAQETYKELKKELKGEGVPVYLLHSRFTLEDRRRREGEVMEAFGNPKPKDEGEGKILVATQVVEASLDIDGDVLFTDLAPLDALVQRMGRVMRRYFYRDGKVWDKSSGEEMDIPEEGLDLTAGPNVFVWVWVKEKEKKLAHTSPYHKEKDLMLWSLAWLWRWGETGGEGMEEFIEKSPTYETISKVFYEPVGYLKEEQSGKGKKGRKKEGDNANGSEKQDFEGSLLGHIKVEEGIPPFPLSEYDKYAIVKGFYDTLNALADESKYIRTFYDTLAVLDAGWVSERKADAQRVFREIYEVKAVPKNLLGAFIEAVLGFDFSQNYTHFKRDVLSRYVVSVPLRWVSLEDRVLNSLKEESRFYELDKKARNKLGRWLADVFVVDGDYAQENGLKHQKRRLEDDAIFI